MNKKQALENGNLVAALTADIEEMEILLADVPELPELSINTGDPNVYTSFGVDRTRFIEFIKNEMSLKLEHLHNLLRN